MNTASLADFFSAWELFRDASTAGALAGAALGLMGVYIVLRRMVFVSAALSQAAGLGVSLAFYAQLQWGLAGFLVSPTVGALVMTIVAMLLLTLDRSGQGGRRDSLLGLAYLAGAAMSLALSTRIAQTVHDVESLLFGTAVAVVPEDFWRIAFVTVGVGALHLWWRRGFIQTAFDRDGAKVRGLPVRWLELALLGTVALTISVCTRVLGALPVFAFTVLPAMAGVRVASSIPQAMSIATVAGALAGFGGYVLAYVGQLPVGASQTLAALAFVVLAELLRPFVKKRRTLNVLVAQGSR